MSQSSLGQYDTIRRLLEHLYTYGMYSREEFVRIGIGKKNYDKLLQLLYQAIPQQSVECHQMGRKKILRISHDSFQNDSDRLAASFALHTVKDDLLAHMAVLLSRFSLRERLTAKEVETAFQLLPAGGGGDKSSTLRRQRAALIRFGYLRPAGRSGRQMALRTLPDWSDGDLQRLYMYADFLAGTSPLRLAPILLRRTVRRALEGRGCPVPPPLFLFRENVCRNLFDEELVFGLLEACERRCAVLLQLDAGEVQAQPAFLRFDVRSGRWYLFARTELGPAILRLSRVRGLKLLPQSGFDGTRVTEEVRERFERCHISSCRQGNRPVLVEAELYFQDAPWERAQFEREMLLGRIIQRDGKEIYQALVNDPVELSPFLRSYGGYVRILPGAH